MATKNESHNDKLYVIEICSEIIFPLLQIKFYTAVLFEKNQSSQRYIT